MTTWNPSDTTVNTVFSNGDLTVNVSSASGNYNTRATYGKSTGKWYFEITHDGVNNGVAEVGIANLSLANTGTGLGGNGNGVCCYSGGDAYGGSYNFSGPTISVGNVVGIAFDMDAQKFWWRVNNGSWYGNGSGNPATNSGGRTFSLAVAYPAVTLDRTGRQITANFGATAFAYAPPSGFAGLDTQGGLAKSLGGLTVSSAATVALEAALSKTLAGVTLASAGGSAVLYADLAKTLANLSPSAAGAVANAAALTKTFAGISFVASGGAPPTTPTFSPGPFGSRPYGSPTDIPANLTAAMSANLGVLSLSSGAGVAVVSALTKTLANISRSLAAGPIVSATVTKTFAAVSFTSTMSVPVAVALTKTLANVTATGAATLPVVAVATKTLANIGFVSQTIGFDRTLHLTRTLGNLSFTANAINSLALYSTVTLAPVTFAATGNPIPGGTLLVTLATAVFLGSAQVGTGAALVRTLANLTAVTSAGPIVGAALTKALAAMQVASIAGGRTVEAAITLANVLFSSAGYELRRRMGWIVRSKRDGVGPTVAEQL